MRTVLTTVLTLALPMLAAAQEPLRARSASYAPDGRLAIASRGDLFVVIQDGTARRITDGPAWDRDPVWTADGRSLVFASDRDGGLDLFRVLVDGSGDVQRLTTSPEADHEPAPKPDGTIVFVRSTGATAELWEMTPDGAERRIAGAPRGAREPAVSPDGQRIAFVVETENRRTLHVRDGTGASRALHEEHRAERPAWSPDGGRIAFASRGRTGGVWLTPPGGEWIMQASRSAAQASWSPDGERLALAELPGTDVGYNGDPDRVGDRRAGDAFRDEGELRVIRAPAPPDAGADVLRVALPPDRELLNAAAFDRVWQRSAELYFKTGGPGAAAWQASRDRYRPRALAAADDRALEGVLHEMLRERPPLRTEASGRAAVSSAHPIATAAGVEILEAGGNVVDAAVAVSFALGVVEPDASGPGGYGEMLIHLAGMQEPVAIEFMTRLPEAYREGLRQMRDGEAHGALLANVPGTVAGMELAWKRHGSGRVSWSRLLEPAIRAAANGFPIDDGFATTLARERTSFERYESSRALFFRDGRPLGVGDTLRNPDLAWMLREIARGGADAFYRGPIAERLVADLRSHGSSITKEDLARYFAADRRPVRTTYRGHAVYSGPPPVSGGASLVAKLNLLEHAARGSSIRDDAAKLHAMIEATKLQPSTNGRIADPDLWPTDVSPFESKDTAAARWRCFDPARASAANAASAGCLAANGRPVPVPDDVHAEDADSPCAVRPESGCRNTGTTSFAVADAAGNAVSVTQTLGTWGGNFYVTPGLGFLYNDKFNSYRSDPDAYGTRLPYARNTTIISPTIVYDGDGPSKRPLLAVGAAGNAWITAAVYSAVVGVIDHAMGPQEALELPRMLPGGGGIQIEDGFAPDAIARLEAMGHSFRRISLKGELRMGYGAAVLVKDGVARAGADPRRSGAAGAAR